MMEIDLLRRSDLHTLLSGSTPPLVSIYLPTGRTGNDRQQAPIRLKNLLSRVEKELPATGLKEGEIRAMLRPARELLDNLDFWQHQAEGLAVFLSSSEMWHYRLPLRFEERAVVNERYHLKPLLPLFAGSGRFYVLALSENRVQFLKGNRFQLHPIPVPGLPPNMAEALWGTGPHPPQAGNGPGPHAHIGQTGEAHKREYLEFFHKVDHALREFLHGDPSPIVLACVDYLMPIYREASHGLNVFEEGISGNPEHTPFETLHERAWALVEPTFRRSEREARERIAAQSGSNAASNELDEIVPAAHYGRVQALFVSLSDEVWGRFCPQSSRIELTPTPNHESEDLLNAAALATLANGGDVYAVPPSDVPGAGRMAALFRY